MILRFHIDVQVRSDDSENDEQEDYQEPPSPSRECQICIFNIIINC
jgi:hypothetical protein